MNGGVRGSAQLSAKSPQQKHKTPRFSEENRGVFVASCGEAVHRGARRGEKSGRRISG